jgi:hypothetical protein
MARAKPHRGQRPATVRQLKDGRWLVYGNATSRVIDEFGDWVDFDHGQCRDGNWNLVSQCSECGRFTHDALGEGVATAGYWRRRFGDTTLRHRCLTRGHQTRWFEPLSGNACTECVATPGCPVERCAMCGKFSGSRRVQHRASINYQAWAPDGLSRHIFTCPMCAGKAIRLAKRINQLNAERISLQRLTREFQRAVKEITA